MDKPTAYHKAKQLADRYRAYRRGDMGPPGPRSMETIDDACANAGQMLDNIAHTRVLERCIADFLIGGG